MADLYQGLELAPPRALAPPPEPKAPPGMYEGLELAPTQQVMRPAEGFLESAQAGYQGSALGLALRRRLPDLVMDPEHAKWWERLTAGVTQVGSELPLMIPGGVAGTAAGTAVGGPVGGILGGGAGMFATPAGVRTSLMELYKARAAQTPADWFNIVRETAQAMLKEGAIGAVTMGTGALARAGAAAALGGGSEVAGAVGLGTATMATRGAARATGATDVAGQIAAMVTMPAALEGRLPNAHEFLDAAGVILVLKGAHVGLERSGAIQTIADRVANVYERTGKTPAEQVADAKENPKIAEELAAPEVPRGTDGRLEMPTIQETLFRDQARQAELEDAAAARPLADPERAELDALRGRIADLEKQVAEGAKAIPPESAPGAPLTAESATQARKAAEERLAALEVKATETPEREIAGPDGTKLKIPAKRAEYLTDAERAERVFLKNNLERPEALVKHFGLEPARITPEAIEASAQRLYDEAMRQLKVADQARQDAGLQPLGDDHAAAVSALVRARARARARRLGVLPEDLYRDRPLRIEDATAAELAKVEAAVPPEAPRYELPEVDLFGMPIAAPVVPRLAVEGLATKEVPLANLTLSKEVPQFKAAADNEGVVVPLGGKFDRTGVGPIQVWERLDGRMEVISGRHRLDLARRSGEETIPAQIHREAEGFDARQAATLDAQLNIREEQGSVADYAQYFKDAGISKEAASELGLLARAKGRTGFAIARDASPDLLAAHRAGLLSDEAALSLSLAAPGSERLQALGMAMVQEGKSILMAINTMKAVDVMAAERMAAGAQGDIFGFDDSAMREASAMAKAASSRQRKIGEQVAAVSGASKRPEIAKKMGVNVEDPVAVRAKIIELRQEQELWDNWPLHHELVAQLRAMAKPGGVTGREGELKQGPVRPPDQQSIANDAWAQNYSDVVGTDLSAASTRNIELATNYAAHVLSNLGKLAQRGEPYNEALMRSMQVEYGALRAEWQTRPDRFSAPDIQRQDAFDLKPETPAELAARNAEAEAQAKRKIAEERAAALRAQGKPVTVDQADLFNTQGTLFQGALEAKPPIPKKDELPEFVRRVVQSHTVDEYDPMHRGPTAGVEAGEMISYHLTDNPEILRRALASGKPLTEGREADKYGDLGRGLYVSGIPHFWGGRSTGKWDFLARITPEERNRIADKLAADPNVTGEQRGYYTESERERAQNAIERFRKGSNEAAGTLANQPLNLNISRGDFLRDLGIQPGTMPKAVEVRLRGRFAELKRHIDDEEGQKLQAMGFDGAFVPMSMGTSAQTVVWNPKAVRIAGEKTMLFQDLPAGPKWYSELERQFEAAKMKQAPAQGWKDLLRGMKGVKADEVKWSGVEEWLDLQQGRVTKDQVIEFLRGNGVRVEEKMMGGATERTPQDTEIAPAVARLAQHQIVPGQEPEGRFWGLIDNSPAGGSEIYADVADLRNAFGTDAFTVNKRANGTWEAHTTDGRTYYADATRGMARAQAIEHYRDELPNSVRIDPQYEDMVRDATAVLEHLNGSTDEGPRTKFGGYQLPGGENYRELALTLPGTEIYRVPQGHSMGEEADVNRLAHVRFNEREAGGSDVNDIERRLVEAVGARSGKSLGSGAPSVGIRKGLITEAEAADWSRARGMHSGYEDKPGTAQRVLFIEEIQSDWAQKGKKEGFSTGEITVEHRNMTATEQLLAGTDFAGPRYVAMVGGRMVGEGPTEAIARQYAATSARKAVPSAPFVGKTDAWVGLVLKRMIRYAAENGFDRVAWTTGAQQVERYTGALRKAVDAIEWKKTEQGVQLVGYKNPPDIRGTGLREGSLVRTKVVDTTEKENALSDAIGKAMAERIIKDPNQEGTIEGENIKIDDTGMAGFYDRIVPSVAKDVLKKLGGGKIEETNLPTAPAEPGAFEYGITKQQSFDITPALRERAMQGLPLFQEHRGSYNVAENLIKTLQGADKSTVVHELTHSWLEEMKADAMRPDAPAALKADWETLRRELAIPASGEIPRASHEQFARSGERYLGEGVAPSIELRTVFERFKQWLLEIYNDLRGLNVQINPELKAVLDRMLATDEEIAAAHDLGVPRAYVPEAKATEARKIVPGFKAEQISMEPYADELPKGPGEAPDNSHVNYAYINTPTDVKLTMQRMAEIDQENIQKQRGGTEGVKSWEEANAEQAKYVNDILGGTPDTLRILSPRDPSAPGPDVRLGILKKLAVGAAKDSARLRDVVLEAGHDATVRQQLEYLGSIERARMIQAEFLGERASVARALNALKDVTEGTGEIGRMLDAIGYGEAAARELFQSQRTPAEEQAYLKAKLDEILQNYKGKSALDIAKLHKEIGTLKGTFRMAKELEKATTWDMVVEGWKAGLLSGPVTHTTNLFGTGAFQVMRAPVDFLASVIGMARGASPGMGESDRASMSEAVARLTGMLGGVQDALKVAKATFEVGEPTGKTESFRQAIPGRAGEIIRLPLRLMGAEDALVSTMYRRGELKTLSIRTAFDEGLNPSTREFAERVDYLMDHPTPEMDVAAETAATRMTFNMPLGEKGVALQLFVNKWNLQWMIPFIRTPINIAKELLRMSPGAPLIGEWRAAIAKGGVERDRALAEVAIGTAVMTATMALAFSTDEKGRRRMTGAGSPDPGKNRGKAGVEQPYSVLVGDTYYEFARIQPTGTLMGMAVDIAEIWDHMTDEEKDKVPKMLARAFVNAITNQTFLQGITNVVNATSDPTRFGPKFVQQLAGSMVPNVIGQPTTMADPVVREVNSMLEAIQARIPGLRQDLLPKRDWLGEPVQTKERLGIVMPVREQQISEDKVRLEAARLDVSMAAAPKKTHIGKGTGKIGDVELTPEERDTFEKVGGEMAHRILGNIVSAPGYDQMPDLVKRNIFAKVLSASHKVAAVAALPMDKRIAYIQSITEKVQAQLAPEPQ